MIVHRIQQINFWLINCINHWKLDIRIPGDNSTPSLKRIWGINWEGSAWDQDIKTITFITGLGHLQVRARGIAHYSCVYQKKGSSALCHNQLSPHLANKGKWTSACFQYFQIIVGSFRDTFIGLWGHKLLLSVCLQLGLIFYNRIMLHRRLLRGNLWQNETVPVLSTQNYS